MKWIELYNGLIIRSQIGQPDCNNFPDYFIRMMNEGKFALDPFHTKKDEEGHMAFYHANRPINVKITHVFVIVAYHVLQLICQTVGEPPPGIMRGTYTLEFVDGKECYKLPAEMFEKGEVPKEELSNWSLMANVDKP